MRRLEPADGSASSITQRHTPAVASTVVAIPRVAAGSVSTSAAIVVIS
jgi:hypothetical protein